MTANIYQGEERRKNVQDHRSPIIICKQEGKIDTICDTLHRVDTSISKLDMRINGSLDKMAIHVEDSIYWRRFIMGVAISLVVSIVGGATALFSLSYNLGQYTKMIQVNTGRLDKIEGFHERLQNGESRVP
jgi:hypothetical protein